MGPRARSTETDSAELIIERRWLLLSRVDPEEFGRFFDKYHKPVLSYIKHRVGDTDIAEDLLSETFLEAVSSLGRFRFQGISLGAFFFRLATRRIAKHFAQERRRQETPFILDDHDPLVPPEGPAVVEADQDAQLIALCLRRLGDQDQDIVVLHYYEGLELAQIAVILGWNENAVKVRLHRARGKLASLLGSPEIRNRLSREGRRALDEMRLETSRLQVLGSGDRGKP